MCRRFAICRIQQALYNINTTYKSNRSKRMLGPKQVNMAKPPLSVKGAHSVSIPDPSSGSLSYADATFGDWLLSDTNSHSGANCNPVPTIDKA